MNRAPARDILVKISRIHTSPASSGSGSNARGARFAPSHAALETRARCKHHVPLIELDDRSRTSLRHAEVCGNHDPASSRDGAKFHANAILVVVVALRRARRVGDDSSASFPSLSVKARSRAPRRATRRASDAQKSTRQPPARASGTGSRTSSPSSLARTVAFRRGRARARG